MTEFSLQDYDNKKFDDLKASIRLNLKVAPKHLINALVKGKTRRRKYDCLMPDLAGYLSGKLCHTYIFYSGDVAVEPSEITAFLLVWIRAVPEADAEACGAKSVFEYEPGYDKLASDLYQAMMAQWRSEYSPSHWRPGAFDRSRMV
jgi:hypothetical protein